MGRRDWIDETPPGPRLQDGWKWIRWHWWTAKALVGGWRMRLRYGPNLDPPFDQ